MLLILLLTLATGFTVINSPQIQTRSPKFGQRTGADGSLHSETLFHTDQLKTLLLLWHGFSSLVEPSGTITCSFNSCSWRSVHGNHIQFVQKGEEAYAEAGKVAEEAISQVRTVYAFVGEEKAIETYSKSLKKALKLVKKTGIAKGIGIGFTFGLLFVEYYHTQQARNYSISAGSFGNQLDFIFF